MIHSDTILNLIESKLSDSELIIWKSHFWVKSKYAYCADCGYNPMFFLQGYSFSCKKLFSNNRNTPDKLMLELHFADEVSKCCVLSHSWITSTTAMPVCKVCKSSFHTMLTWNPAGYFVARSNQTCDEIIVENILK